MKDDAISRQDAIDALWKALYDYEDKTEKQFQESKELDIADWIQHRIFVQNMNDIDRQTILALPSVQPYTEEEIQRMQDMEQIQLDKAFELGKLDAQEEIIRCKDCKHWMPYDWMFSEVWRSKDIDDYSEDEIGCAYCDMNMGANDFCSRPERRTDDSV